MQNQLKPEERTRCEVWTRVMGYHRPTASFNKGKQGEHRERRFFTEAAARGTVRRKTGPPESTLCDYSGVG